MIIYDGSHRITNNTPKNFRYEAHVLDKADGSADRYILLDDLIYDHEGDSAVKRQTLIAPASMRTDFASIPTVILKKILEPARFIKSSKYVSGLKYPVWIYREIEGKNVLVGYRNDPVAYAAIIHDAIVRGEMLGVWKANHIFNKILHDEAVPQRIFLYIGVQLGCWIVYITHNAEEVQKTKNLIESRLKLYHKY